MTLVSGSLAEEYQLCFNIILWFVFKSPKKTCVRRHVDEADFKLRAVSHAVLMRLITRCAFSLEDTVLSLETSSLN